MDSEHATFPIISFAHARMALRVLEHQLSLLLIDRAMACAWQWLRPIKDLTVFSGINIDNARTSVGRRHGTLPQKKLALHMRPRGESLQGHIVQNMT